MRDPGPGPAPGDVIELGGLDVERLRIVTVDMDGPQG